METAARKLKVDPAELRRKNFITQFPLRRPYHGLDIGDFNASLDAAMKAIDYAGFAGRKAKAKSEGKLRGIGVSCYKNRGLRHRALEGRSVVSAPRGFMGIRRSPRQPGRHIEVLTGSHSHGRAMRRASASSSPNASAIPLSQVQIVHGDTDKGSSAWHLGSRSAAVASPRS